MPSGFTSTTANRQPAYTGDDVVFGKIYCTGGLDLSGAGVPSGAAQVAIGAKRNVLTGATVLTATQSGSLCLWNAAAGYLFTLPTPVIGLYYDFLASATCTSVGMKVITKVITTDFIIGHVFVGIANTTPAANPGPKFFIADGTANAVSINMYGVSSDTTTGGVLGSGFRLTCVSATQWGISNCLIAATGTIATPVAAS